MPAPVTWAPAKVSDQFKAPRRAVLRVRAYGTVLLCIVVMFVLQQDPYDMEWLVSFDASKGGSTSHLALALRDQAPGDDLVYSANFCADRKPEHEKGFYTDDLMVRIPKRKKTLFKTTSSLGDTASFGLDLGEVYKRSLIGMGFKLLTRVQRKGLPSADSPSDHPQ